MTDNCFNCRFMRDIPSDDPFLDNNSFFCKLYNIGYPGQFVCKCEKWEKKCEER